ncbi:MAG: inclusion body family protein [Reichenbachiella sp.]|uniref:inclusion body family protein n=1 Tax=Reichenbachiella sp. TaxID=2184521 RepID=UPI003267DEA2
MNNIINVQVTIDTEAIINDFPSPSTDPANPTGIGHQYQYMVVTDGASISGQGGADLNFAAQVGDNVRFHGTSASDNFENALLIYGIDRFGGDQVFSPFMSFTYVKNGVAPTGVNVLPAHIGSQQFWFYEGRVIAEGVENFKVVFALYSRDSNGLPIVHGYFSWDPTVTVNG